PKGERHIHEISYLNEVDVVQNEILAVLEIVRRSLGFDIPFGFEKRMFESGEIPCNSSMAIIHRPIAYQVSLLAHQSVVHSRISLRERQRLGPEPKVVKVAHKAVSTDNQRIAVFYHTDIRIFQRSQIQIVLIDPHAVVCLTIT